ncbi:diguanylate cyclase domain-containing protein [Shewanella sp. 5S214]|uniref:sensor domain-containing diguanylate cyclase n=1 Tax=Shewanella sp. 5S214 TaxID=3229999 RepID=UPI00352E8419
MNSDAPFGVVIHQDFIPLYADDSYAKIFGYQTAKEILALKSILELIDPELQDLAAHTYYALMSGIEKPQVRNYINRNRLGMTINVLAIEHLVEWQGRTALQITIVDLTEVTTLKQAVVQSEHRYQQLANGSVQGVLVHRNFSPLYCNETLATLLGYPNRQSIMSLKSIMGIIEPSYQAQRIEANNALLANTITPQTVDIQCLHSSGRLIWVKILETVISWEGQPATQMTMIDITESYLLKDLLNKEIYIDYLTKVLNRRGLLHFSQRLITDTNLKREHLYCLLIGVDDLKQINHLFGHKMGDKALVNFAQHCQNNLGEVDLIARWSGDEFITIIQANSKKIVLNIAENIRHSNDDTSLIEPETNKPIRFSASVGVSNWQADDTIDSFILRADSALEQARSQITNQLVFT